MKQYTSEELDKKFTFAAPTLILRALGALIAAKGLNYLYCFIPGLRAIVLGALAVWLFFAVLTGLSAYGNVQSKRAAIGPGEGKMLLILGMIAIVFAVGWGLENARGIESCAN